MTGSARESVDATSDTWAAVQAWAATELATAQRAVATPGLAIEPTERARGAIALLLRLQDLPTAKTYTVPPPADYTT